MHGQGLMHWQQRHRTFRHRGKPCWTAYSSLYRKQPQAFHLTFWLCHLGLREGESGQGRRNEPRATSPCLFLWARTLIVKWGWFSNSHFENYMRWCMCKNFVNSVVICKYIVLLGSTSLLNIKHVCFNHPPPRLTSAFFLSVPLPLPAAPVCLAPVCLFLSWTGKGGGFTVSSNSPKMLLCVWIFPWFLFW